MTLCSRRSLLSPRPVAAGQALRGCTHSCLTQSDCRVAELALDALVLEKAEMSTPNLQVAIEPFEAGGIVYAPMAPPALGKLEQGRLILQLAISNLEPNPVQLESLSVTPGSGSFSSKTLPLEWFWTVNGIEQSATITIAASQTLLWWFQHQA